MIKVFSILKKVLLAVLVLVVLFFVINFILFLFINKGLEIGNKYIFKRENFSIEHFMNSYNFKEPAGLGYKKPAIIIFGDGTAAGEELEENQAFDNKLSEYLKRPVYNRAVLGGGIQHALMQAESHLMDDIIKNSDYAIYILPSFIDNISLITYPGTKIIDPNFIFNLYVYPRYKKDNDGNLVLYKTSIPFIKENSLFRIISKWYKSSTYSKTKNMELFELYLMQLQSDLLKINPNIKLVLFIYYEDFKNTIYKPVISMQNGIEVVFANSLTENNLIEDSTYRKDGHPTAEAWEMLTPLFAKEVGLK